MQLTKEILKACLPFAKQVNIDKFINPLNVTLEKFQINTPVRIAMFLAQLAHESGSFKYVEEIATGEAYEGRGDLGNVLPGDGVKFKGRGLIQITGRTNYGKLSTALSYDFIGNPEALELPGPASMSTGWFWKSRGLNEIADANSLDAFKKVTKKINGGFNGLADRLAHWERCKKALNVV